jgi:tungstate transport system substrate-binding protein
MYNDFVLVGPDSDPANIRGTTDATTALSRIVASNSLFISRGDTSGTHKKELQLWEQAGISPQGQWYREAGQGMGKVLQIAGELDAYSLTDRGTWLAYRNKVPLVIVTEGDKRLFNPYGIIAANPARYPDANYSGAMALINWITSPAAQNMIGNFTIDEQRLFVPMHDPVQSAK